MRWSLAVLLVGACGGRRGAPQAEMPESGREPMRGVGFCPPIEELGSFAHELFPACPAPPIRYQVRLCGEHPCAAPCAYRWAVTGSAVEESRGEETYTYDAAGRLATVTKDGSTRTCQYDAKGRLYETCIGDPVDVRRSADGRLLAIGGLELTWDDAGRVTKLGADELTYDASGLLVTFSSRRFEWEGLRLLAEHFGDDATPLRYRYDARGYLVKLGDDNTTTDLVYEGNRLVRIVSAAADERVESTFAYDCQ